MQALKTLLIAGMITGISLWVMWNLEPNPLLFPHEYKSIPVFAKYVFWINDKSQIQIYDPLTKRMFYSGPKIK